MAAPAAALEPDAMTGQPDAIVVAVHPERVLGRRSRGGGRLVATGAGVVGAMCLLALLGPVLAGSLLTDGAPFAAPSLVHPLGTDDLGRDLLGQLLLGGRTSIAIALTAAAIATVVGGALGLAAGLLAGRADTVIARGLDIVLALPFLPLVIVVGAFLGPGPVGEALVIGLAWSAHTGRVIRSQALEARSRPHVEAVRAMGAPMTWVARRHLLPIVAPLLVPQFVRAAGAALIAEASLTFLGLGDPTIPSWGGTIAFGQARGALLTGAWAWWIVPPGLCIAVIVTALAVLGFGLEERVQPRIARWAGAGAGRTVGHAGSPAGVGSASGARPVDPGAVLEVADLAIEYADDRTGEDAVRAVRGVSFAVAPGETLGIVGESGSGKSTIAAALLALPAGTARTTAGTVRFEGRDLATLQPEELRALRGRRIALVPQNAMAGLDPVMAVGDQVAEVVRAHARVTAAEARRRARAMLARVGIDAARARALPHELSGGMRQRVVIAMALVNEPVLLVADEPTTGLDVIVAAEIAELLAGLRDEQGMAMVVVSHDLPTIARLADRVLVMADGEVVEAGQAARVFGAPEHPATARLVAAVPRLAEVGG